MYDIRKVLQGRAEGFEPVMMWFSSGNINKAEMTRQLEGFHEKGIRDFFIHAAIGSQGDYLGSHFFGMIRHAVAEAKRLNMKFWLYDEYNWPSGVAAGQVLVEAPWARSRCLCRVCQPAAAGETVRVSLPGKERYDTEVTFCCTEDGEVKATVSGDTLVWTNTADGPKTLEIYLSKWLLGKYDALAGAEIVEPSAEGYLDTLNRDAVNVFIKKTHEVYKAQIGEEFGGCVRGIFTDEVPIWRYQEMDPDIQFLPWTGSLPEKFFARCGYRMEGRLKELFDGTDDKLTMDFWETVADMFMDAYMKNVHDWCEANGLIFTGHIVGEESLGSNVFRSGDPYDYYSLFDWPGVDSIYSDYRITDYSFDIASKLASSAARFTGKERVLSETFGLSSWRTRLRDIKRIFNRQALLGVDCIQYMGARYDFRPGLDSSGLTNNWQNPLFRHYGKLTDYISGIQKFVAETEYDAETLLFYPMTSARVTLPSLPNDGFFLGEANFTVEGLVNSLGNLHIPFELGYEQVIENAEVENGRLKIAGSEYHTVILPCTLYLREKTFKKLWEFAETGGHIIAVNGVPEKVIGNEVYDAPAFKGAVCYDCREYELSGQHVTGCETYARAPMGAFTEKLRQAMRSAPSLPVRLRPRDGIFSAARRKDGQRYLMIINDNDISAAARGEFAGDISFRVLNAENGEPYAVTKEGNTFEIMMEPFGCVIMELFAEAEPVKRSGFTESTELSLTNVTFRPDGLNTALPDMRQVRGEAAEEIIRARRAFNPKRVCELAARLSGEETVPCRGLTDPLMPIKSVRDWYGWQPVDGKVGDPGETVVAVYDFTVDHIPSHLEMVSSPQIETAWYLNGEQLYQTSADRVWHYANPVYDLTGIAVPGKNRLVSISTLPGFRMKFDLPIALLRGDFRVYDDLVLTGRAGGNAIAPWNGQGYYFYTGDGTYRAEFTVPKDGKILLKLDTADAAEVFVNGAFAGKLVWDPYELDLTPFVKEGGNLLEIRVTGTLSTLLYDYDPCGLRTAKLLLQK